MPNIPEDIVIHILESSNHWWSRDLSRFALVSHVWLIPARARLYTQPLLMSYRACFLLHRALNNNPFLASLIRGLDLRPSQAEEEYVYRGYIESVHLLLGLPSLRLKELALGGQLSCQAERFLRAVGNPQYISSLRIAGSEEGSCGESSSSLEWDTWEFSARFHNLKKLELVGPMYLEVYRDAAWGRKSDASPCQVEELYVIGIQNFSGLLAHLFTATSWSSLRTLVLLADTDDFEDNVQLASLLRMPLPLLESLSIEYRKQYCPYRASPLFDTNTGNLSFLGHFPSDEEFPEGIFNDVYKPAYQFSSLRNLCLTSLCLTPDALTTISQLFPNIQSLMVKERCDNLISLQEWARFHEDGNLNQLTHFNLVIDGPKCRREWPPKGLDNLEVACASSKVELSYAFSTS